MRPGGAGGDRLVAWWVPSGPVAEAALREQVAAVLPNYMVPAAFVAMDAMPRTRNGKLDAAALPEPEAVARPAASAAPGRAAAQDVVADAWCEVLGTAQVSGDEDFFALGGHSMLAARDARGRAAGPADLGRRAVRASDAAGVPGGDRGRE